jgi:TPR repeat protein/serine/threonine protein kinase
MSSANHSQTIVDVIESIGNELKTIKVYRKKSHRLFDRLGPIADRASQAHNASPAELLAVLFAVKETHSFIHKFSDPEYVLQSWSASIDMERFADLTQSIYECYTIFSIPHPADQSTEDEQDKKEDFESMKKFIESLAEIENVRAVSLGVEHTEGKNIEALKPSGLNVPVEKTKEIRVKVDKIDEDIQNYELLPETLDFTQLECDRHSHLNKIGEGKFGIVYKGNMTSGPEVAVKFFRETNFTAEKQAAIKKDIAKLQLLKHKNVIEYFGSQTKTLPYYHVFEKAYCSLYSALYARDENEKLGLTKSNYRRKLEILLDCCRGIDFLHSVNVLHRNIKSTNVLIMADGSAKIADFSFAMSKQDLNSSLSGAQGTNRASLTAATLSASQKVFPAYLAPEVLLNTSKDQIQYNLFTDAYAFGILANEVFSHKPPFPGLTFRNVMAKLQKSDNNRPALFASDYFNQVNSRVVHRQGNGLILELQMLIERCWTTAATNRPSFHHVLLILERVFENVGALDEFEIEPEGGKTPLPSNDEGIDAGVNNNTPGGNQMKSFFGKKSFYRSNDTAETNDDDLNISRDTNDVSPTKEVASPNRINKIATIIESYEKGFGSQSYDRSFDRSMDVGDASYRTHDRFERSMDRSHDPNDVNRTKSSIGFSKSKSASLDQSSIDQGNANANNTSMKGMFDPLVPEEEGGNEESSIFQTKSMDNDKPPLPPTNSLDLNAMGIAIEHIPSKDSKISDISMELSQSTESTLPPHPPVTAKSQSFIEVQQTRTFDSFDSNAPKPSLSLDAPSMDHHKELVLQKTKTLDSLDMSVTPSDDPEYNHNKYIAQLFYDAGSCGKKDATAALEALATENNLLALGFYMGMLCYGSGIVKDVKRANDIAKQIYPMIMLTADDENSRSRRFYQYIAGLFYEQGLGVPKNDELAVKYYQLSADQGYAAALSNLGYCYKHGQGVREDRYEAVRLYGLGSDQNHATSLNNLGYCYQHGYGVQKDLPEAVKLYQRSAEQGHATAQNNLGYCYQYGQGCEKNLAEAVRLYELSASQGCSFGQNSLGHCYKRGHGVPKDYNKAVYYYRLAAEQGHATAQNNLGYCYQYGQGVEINYPEAVKWYKLSVDQGQASAENNLGFCYQCGIGVKKDLGEAVKLYTASSEKGYAVAMYNLGLCYLNGMGVPQDATKGVQMIRASAEQGHTAGQVKLAMCYEEGVGVTKDTREAIRWYVMAARRNDETAMKALKRLHG